MNKVSEPLVSVIVPIYGVEKYLPCCLDSLQQQTYRNLEIILIDDGSPDGCGAICDRYAADDGRIRVIHQANGGLSAARNAGMEIMTGKYVTFVDSDDWLDPLAIEKMVEMADRYGVEMSAVRFQNVPEGKEPAPFEYKGIVRHYEKVDALETFLFAGHLSPCAWGKLWEARLWKDLRFPEGKLYEDQYTVYKALDRIGDCVMTTDPLYFYRKRPGSIGHSGFSAKKYELLDAVGQECEYISSRYPEIRGTMAVARLSWEMVFVDMLIAAGQQDEPLFRKIRRQIRKNRGRILDCPYLPRARRMQMFLFAAAPSLYRVLYIQYKKKHPYS